MAVISLVTETVPISEVDAETVSLLENMLAKAKSGEIQGVAMVMVNTVGSGCLDAVATAYAGEGIRQNVHAALGGIAWLQQRWIDERVR
jgi:hypothetical protein